MRFFFRVDSGDHIGFGHISRCTTLALALLEEGHEIVFITRNHAGSNYNFKSEIKHYNLSSLLENNKDKQLNYSKWSGESVSNEVESFERVVKELGCPDWTIIDHYGLDIEYESKISSKKIFVIDDLFNRKHKCDVLLNQNLDVYRDDYRTLVNEEAFILAGLKYVILNKRFREIRDSDIEAKYVTVYFGGTDLTGETIKTVKALKNTTIKNVKVILPKNHEDFSAISKLVSENINIDLVEYVEDMAMQMKESKLFIGACGTTSWERCCLGTPSICITSASNQCVVADGLRKRKAIHYLGNGTDLNIEDWIEAMKILNNEKKLEKLSRNSLGLIDGYGIDRVVDIITKG